MAELKLERCDPPGVFSGGEMTRADARSAIRLDLIRADRGVFDHVGLRLARDMVIHFTGEIMRAEDAVVAVTSLPAFQRRSALLIEDVPIRLSPDLSLLLALAHIGAGRGGYEVSTSNCEHVAYFCLTGCWYSGQVGDLQREIQAKRAEGMRAMRAMLDAIVGRLTAVVERGENIRPLPSDASDVAEQPPQVAYLGELWRGLGGGLHSRVQVRRHMSQPFSDFDGRLQTEPGAWIEGGLNTIALAPRRRFTFVSAFESDSDDFALVAAGLASLDAPHLRAVLSSWQCQVDRIPRTMLGLSDGPLDRWRHTPATWLGKAASLTGLPEFSLSNIGQWWAAIDFGADRPRVRLLLRTPYREWFDGGDLDCGLLPGGVISPLLGRDSDGDPRESGT